MDYSDWKLWFSAQGRINRRPYFFAGLAAAALLKLNELIPEPYTLLYLPVILVAIYITVVLAIKRSHDRGRTGWFTLIFFVPFLNLWPTIELTFFRGVPGPNRWGPNPLESADAAPAAATQPS